jgi:DNA replication licensing factor MCM2
MPAFDRYETDVLDDEEYDDISQSERAAAEAAMRRRDRDEGILTRRDDLELIYGMHYIILLQAHMIMVFLD